MICPHCHQEAGDGRYCPHCGKPLPYSLRRKALIAAAASGLGIVLALVLWFAMLKPAVTPVPDADPMPSARQEETSDTEEEAPMTEAQKLASLPAQEPDNDDRRDWICGIWKGDDYTAKVQKVGEGLYRWQKQDSTDDPIRVTAGRDSYSLTDAMNITYTCSLADFDLLVFSEAVTDKKQAATSYSIPWQARWVRLDQNGQPMNRASLNTTAFDLLGQDYAAIRSAYTVKGTAWREGPLMLLDDCGTTIAVSFDGGTDSQWGMAMDDKGNPALPPDDAVCVYAEGPLSFFVALRKDSLSVDELTDLLSGDQPAVAHKDKCYIAFDSGGQSLQLHYGPQGEELNKDTSILIWRADRS
jgi:hypothetical protein